MALIKADSCPSCAFCFQEKGEHYCRRNPPQNTTMWAPTNKGPTIFGAIATWPKVNSDWWCGEYKRGVLRAQDLDVIDGGRLPIKPTN